jgi:hypothetical protein
LLHLAADEGAGEQVVAGAEQGGLDEGGGWAVSITASSA